MGFQVCSASIPIASNFRENFGSSNVVYVGISKYYDNRQCVVTSSLDDFSVNATSWDACLSMMAQKRIFSTLAIITNWTDWSYAQYWLNQGYAEAASHSRTHVSPPYSGFDGAVPRVSYEWQIGGSRDDIVGNLTLPSYWRNGNKQYVYAWIEPYGQSDATVRQFLGLNYYLCDRGVLAITPVPDLSPWVDGDGLFGRSGYTVEMGNPPWGGVTSAATLNQKFDAVYKSGGVYHLTAHPLFVDWSKGGYADVHTSYISNRTDVWYVPLGLLYLYNWVNVRNVTQVSSDAANGSMFKISVSSDNHENYGVSYPVTYVFQIPANWKNGYVYYRTAENSPWLSINKKNPTDFFNGVNAARFDFNQHKVYVSVAFASQSDNLYLQILPFSLYSLYRNHT